MISSQNKTLRVLDLFCGMGGWSIGFHREGFDCIGVDIVDVGYPYDFIHADIHGFHFPDFYDQQDSPKIDVVVASPPCTEFSVLTKGLAAMGKHSPPDPEKGMELVKEAKRVVEEVKPKFWLIENVGGAVKPFYPFLGGPRAIIKPYYLWGNFPRFLRESSYMAPKIHKIGLQTGSMMNAPGRFSPLAPWLLAKIPYPLSLGLARACKEALS